MQELFDKVSGVNIFALKSYMEPTSSLDHGAWGMLNDVLVNLPFMILNLVVGFFSVLMKLLENLDLTELYEKSVYAASKSMWNAFIGGKVLTAGSLVWLLIALSSIVLFFYFTLSRGNIGRKIFHLLAVLVIGFAYFGTVNSTDGGLYVLQGIRSVAKETVESIASLKIDLGEGHVITMSEKFSDTYIAETSFRAYLFTNTGRTDGKFVNKQEKNELQDYDSTAILGKKNKDGKFEEVERKKREDTLQKLGDGASDGVEMNTWNSAIGDFIFIRMFYVWLMILKAIVLALPILFVQLISLLAQVVVLGLMLLIPVALVASFIPSFQNIIFGVVKTMLIGSVLPSGMSVVLLFVLLIERMASLTVVAKAEKIIAKMEALASFSEVFNLAISVVVSIAVYMALWKYKGNLLGFILGSGASAKMDEIGATIQNQISDVRENAFEMVQRTGDFALYTAGMAAGALAAKRGSTGEENQEDYPDYSRMDPAVMEEEENLSAFDEDVAPHAGTGRMAEAFYSGNSPIFGTEAPAYEEALDSYEGAIQDYADELEPVLSDMDQSREDLSEVLPRSGDESAGTEFSDLAAAQPAGVENELEQRKKAYQPKRKQKKAAKLQEKLDVYQDDQAYYQGQGNSFQRGFLNAQPVEARIKSNIQRRDNLLHKLERLRGES
ncbi:hypothetical protein [Streptococcus sanguinis]|uniref:hypothetical protein n=1 Tax=Streptococcus sanguinis TaxID=1305 RepID=UPI0031B5B44C